MKYKTAFQLGVKLIALFLCATSINQVVLGVAGFIIMFVSGGPFGITYALSQLLTGPVQFGVGVVIWLAAPRIAGLAVPSNRPYCQECGYDLSGRTADGVCPECGAAFAVTPRDRETAAQQRFTWLCRRLSPEADSARVLQLFETLVIRYAENHRHYHTLRHVLGCLDALDRHRTAAESSEHLALAIWYHDCIYDPRRRDNEERSAQQAAEAAVWLGASESVVNAVRELVLATRHQAPPQTPDAALLIDIDLAVLGGPAVEYDAYAEAIRREFGHVSDAEFAAGRTAFLRSMLARPRIFNTAGFQRSHEECARRNMQRELERIEASRPAEKG